MTLISRFAAAVLATATAAACQRPPLLDARKSPQETMRTVLERRGAYARACPEHHVLFSRYFVNGRVDGVAMKVVKVANLEASSGRIVVADPFYVAETFTAPFVRRVAPGSYPVLLAVANFATWGDRVAFASLRVSSMPVVRWEVAETSAPGKLTQFFGVDAGLASFADAASATALANALHEFQQAHPDGNYYDDVLSGDFSESANWCVHHPAGSSTLNVVVFSSGLGDGLYSSYWGMDAAGQIAQLVVDLQLFDATGPIVRR